MQPRARPSCQFSASVDHVNLPNVVAMTGDQLSAPVLRTPVVWIMALAAAVGTASFYPLQPGISDVADDVNASLAEVGVALACGPVGYLLGLALLVPLVDRMSPRRVLSAQFGALAAALAVNAGVRSAAVLGVVLLVIGAGSAVGVQLSSIAGRFAAPERRATDLGIVTAGISAGILLGRVGGGWLTDLIGWRRTLLLLALGCVVVAVVAYAVLPAASGKVTAGYLAALRGLPGLFVRCGSLRLAAARGALWFFAFCALWAGLAVVLSQPPFSYPPETVGSYACAGLLGIVATRIAGAWTDRVGARRVILVGLAIAFVATVVLGANLSNAVVAFICLGVFDAGLFTAQVANQATVLAIDPDAPARLNSAYTIVYFVGGSVGTAFGAAGVGWFGWLPTAAVIATAIAVAAGITVFSRTKGYARSTDQKL